MKKIVYCLVNIDWWFTWPMFFFFNLILEPYLWTLMTKYGSWNLELISNSNLRVHLLLLRRSSRHICYWTVMKGVTFIGSLTILVRKILPLFHFKCQTPCTLWLSSEGSMRVISLHNVTYAYILLLAIKNFSKFQCCYCALKLFLKVAWKML